MVYVGNLGNVVNKLKIESTYNSIAQKEPLKTLFFNYMHTYFSYIKQIVLYRHLYPFNVHT